MIDLEKLIQAISNGWVEDPFEHVIVDGLFSPKEIERFTSELPPENSQVWGQADHAHQVGKLFCEYVQGLPTTLQEIALAFLHPELAMALRKICDDTPVFPDPYFFGGGLHAMRTGGYLSPHCDPDYHIPTGLRRAITIVLYLNSATPNEAGELVLYDGRNPSKSVKPVAGRCIIFKHSKQSIHAVRKWQGEGLRYTFGAFFYAPDEAYKKLVFSPRWTVTSDEPKRADTIARTGSQLAFAASRLLAYGHQQCKQIAYRLAANANSPNDS